MVDLLVVFWLAILLATILITVFSYKRLIANKQYQGEQFDISTMPLCLYYQDLQLLLTQRTRYLQYYTDYSRVLAYQFSIFFFKAL